MPPDTPFPPDRRPPRPAASPVWPSRRLDEIARRSLAQVRRALRADAAQIQVMDVSCTALLVDLFDCALPGESQPSPNPPRPLAADRTALLDLETHPDPERRALLEGLDSRQLAVTPLVSPARILGSLMVARHVSRAYTADE